MSIGINAQNIYVKSFQVLPNDLDARVNYPKEDQNGDKCAIVKVVTTESGFFWDVGTIGVVDSQKKHGEFWLYLPHGANHITITHDKLGVLRNYVFPQSVNKATVYEMVLTTGRVRTVVEDAEILSEWVIITSVPQGADVYINEKNMGITPFRMQLKENKYTYRLEKPLYHPLAGTFDLSVAQGKKQISHSLKPNFGYAHITSTPETGAQISIDGIPQKQITPWTTPRLKSGVHTITVEKSLFASKSQKISIVDNETIQVPLKLDPQFGRLTINTSPETGAQLYLDEKRIDGTTPCVVEKLSSGVHSITVRKKWYETTSEQISLEDNQQKEITLSMRPTFGEVVITTDSVSQIYIDNARVGQGSYKGRLLAGIHTFEARKDKYTPAHKKMELLVGASENVMLVPQAQCGTLVVDSEPFDAIIELDGTKRGTSPMTLRNLLVGTYSITLKKDGFITQRKNITISENQTLNIKETLNKKLADDLTDIQELKRLSRANNPQAMALLGERYYYGNEVEKNYVLALSLLKKSAEMGYSRGQVGYARMFINGFGVEQNYNKGIKWIKLAIDQNDFRAQHLMGWCYKFGKGVDKNEDKAVLWFRKSAEQGYAKAQKDLGLMYEYGKGVQRDAIKASEFYRKAADNGNLIAQTNLGNFYRWGTGVTKDLLKAKECFQKAADGGYARAQVELGLMYDLGRGVEKDYDKAVRWYQKAVDQGDKRAICFLGDMYEYGKGVEKDEKRAVDMYRQTAEKGYSRGEYYLGRMYYYGKGVSRGYRKAVSWFRKAAAQNNHSAQNFIGICYEYGRGVKKDEKESAKWYRKAADGGSSMAQCNLGISYYYGTGVSCDYKEAVKWYKKSAENGNSKGQYKLGYMYERGRGVKKDLTKAKMWYEKSAAQGYQYAKNALDKLK